MKHKHKPEDKLSFTRKNVIGNVTIKYCITSDSEIPKYLIEDVSGDLIECFESELFTDRKESMAVWDAYFEQLIKERDIQQELNL
jgi:hypothetical protein